MTHTSPVLAIIVAGGSGTRLGGPVPKQYLPLAGQPILRRAVQAFLDHPAIAGVIVVRRADDAARAAETLNGLPLLAMVDGGAERQESVRLGLEAAARFAPDRVLVHDAARPVVPREMIDRVLAGLDRHVGCIPVLPLADTVKQIDAAGQITGTLDRSRLARAQTPQGFRFADLLAAHRQAMGQTLTDDAAVLEAAGHAVGTVPGDPRAHKITTEEDLRRMERDMVQALTDIRVGTGYDVHAFGPNVALKDCVMLCGVAVPHNETLAGHSDADVGLHALTDAILGALSAGDIGSHFPPSDPQWKGAASDRFLRHAAALVAERGGVIAHCDVTLVCEAPKIGPHRAAMAARIAEILAIAPDRVSVKATTTEQLGFTGRREGIAALASATLRLPDSPVE